MKACSKCGVDKPFGEFSKDKQKISGYTSRCKSCQKADYDPVYNSIKCAEYREKNSEKISQHMRDFYEANKEMMRKRNRDWYHNNIEFARQKQRDKWPETYAKHKDAFIYKGRFRDKTISLQCPPWADKDVIKAIYKQARRMTKETGIKYHVDHIIPLQGELVSGLHVPDNLQIITEYENLSKGNRVDLEVLN